MQKFIQTYIIFKERVILRIVKLFFHNNLTDSKLTRILQFKIYHINILKNQLIYYFLSFLIDYTTLLTSLL